LCLYPKAPFEVKGRSYTYPLMVAMTESSATDAPSHVPQKPSAPHPIALALFTSLERDLADKRKREKNGKVKSEDALDCNDAQRSGREFLRRRCQTAGWRNRHSQSELYPVCITTSFANDVFRSKSIMEGDSLPKCSIEHEMEDGEIDITFHVRQVQCGELEETYGTGATVWPASMVLLKYMENIATNRQLNNCGDCKGFFEGKTVADLGSGTGLTSVAAALFGASLIICSDGCELVVDLARDNLNYACKGLKQIVQGQRREGFGQDDGEQHEFDQQSSLEAANFWIGKSEIRARKYLWGDGSIISELDNFGDKDKQYSLSKGNILESSSKTTKSGEELKAMSLSQHHFDIILVSDCVLPKLYPIGPLVDAIDELSGPNTLSLLSYEQRYYPEFDPKEEFCRLATLRNLVVRTVPQEELDPIYSAEDIEIWEVRRT